MSFRPLPLPDGVPGHLWLDAMPGRFERWDRFLARARRAELNQVICLSPMSEVAALARDYHDAIVQGRLPFAWRLLPMRNFGLADDDAAWVEGVQTAAHDLRAGQALLLHCAAGIGRTGTVAACVLKSLGLPEAEALARVRAAGSNPETALQSGRLARF